MADGSPLQKRAASGNCNNLISLHPRTSQSSTQATSAKPVVGPVVFDRRELNLLLRVYGFKVASGEWRDYAIDMLKDRAVFSVFRRSSETPLFAIEKKPKLARKQGAYAVVNASGHILRRGRDLAQVLRVLEKKPKLVSI